MRKKCTSGQTLAEIVVAIGVVVLLVTGLIVGTSVTLKASQYSKARSQATQYAVEAVERVRTVRDAGWTEFSSTYGGTTQCFSKDGQWTVKAGTCGANIDNVFTREVVFTWQDPKMKVDVSLSWTDGNKTYTVPISTYVTQWK